MRFLLSVIAFCLVMITAKLYIPVAQAQECGTFDDNGMYIICDDIDDVPYEFQKPLTLEDIKKDLKSDIKAIKMDIRKLQTKSSHGLSPKEILDLVDDNCRTGVIGAPVAHAHQIRCNDL
ncbi:hypothetical protein N9Q90_02890 [Gammaproteobacteria bacterium]|nr:hypothetical protein [Gammaproteobacteria bacterium]